MAADIERTLGIPATIQKGASGVFEVLHDGEVVFSKKALGRFPQAGEVEAALRKRLEG